MSSTSASHPRNRYPRSQRRQNAAGCRSHRRALVRGMIQLRRSRTHKDTSIVSIGGANATCSAGMLLNIVWEPTSRQPPLPAPAYAPAPSRSCAATHGRHPPPARRCRYSRDHALSWSRAGRHDPEIYLHADLALNERALAKTTPVRTPPGRYRPNDALVAFSRGCDYADAAAKSPAPRSLSPVTRSA